MKQKVVDFNQLSDIIGFRVLVDTVQECYQVQRLLASELKIIPGSFKDYIRVPKHNCYQSLHCVFSLPPYEHIEIQIRTYEMNELAENGTAHHVLYKQEQMTKRNPLLTKILQHAVPNVAKVLKDENQESHGYIYCFTPQGDAIFLPSNSTCLDFAIKLHSDFKSQATHALINGEEVSLETSIKTGDEIYIYTHPEKAKIA